MTDDELVRECLKRNAHAQKTLYNRYASMAFGVCLRYMKNREEAADVLQEGMIKVFEKLDTWNGTGALGGWIRRIMVNTCLNVIRSHKIKGSVDGDWEKAGMDATDSHADALSQMQTEELVQAVQRLPTGYRTVFNLFAIEGYSHQEIGELLGISESTSKTQYFKAKAKLVTWLEKQHAHVEKNV